jgi:propanediol dehydratase large subunit
MAGSAEHVVPIRPFIRDIAFGPEVISVMGTAFEDVCKALAVSGRSDVTKELIATKIIELARGGEIDPIVLREMVLSELGLSQLREGP